MNLQLLSQMILAERVDRNHASWNNIAGELKNSLAGAGGEARVLALLKRELDLEPAPLFFTDLSFPNKEGFSQVDLLLLHPNFVCVLEVKNMRGDFYFNSENFQFHRIVDGRVEGMRNPEWQLHRAMKAAEKYLGVPVSGAIVLANRSGRVVEGPKIHPVLSLDYLPFHIESLVYKTNAFDVEGLAARLRDLPKGSFPNNLLERHQLSIDSLRLGVTCPNCRTVALERKNRKWHCAKCGGFFQDAHEVTLQEYAVLFGRELPTRFAYQLLRVEDKYLLYRLLEKSALQGNERGKRWIVPRVELLEAYFSSIYR
ncbi:nuclease-like protein [Planomicrobium soli]|uniref:Nuclease-like protein n=1 Tax=Planomicrobium soli TaxID=1176648 RepID=A0A2P8GMD9_9BACL|nr:nuclease-related domain-containing protein [Planomicrobium soli]PSL35133.1 nuclease-like protein [Planomicrobium soli]